MSDYDRLAALIEALIEAIDTTPDEMTVDTFRVIRFEEITRVRSLAASGPPPVGALREAAQAVVNGAEPDDNFDGEFIDYLVPFEAIDALRAALASSAAPRPQLDSGAMARSLDANPRKRHHDETTPEGWAAWWCVPAVDAVGDALDAAAPRPEGHLWVAATGSVAPSDLQVCAHVGCHAARSLSAVGFSDTGDTPDGAS